MNRYSARDGDGLSVCNREIVDAIAVEIARGDGAPRRGRSIGALRDAAGAGLSRGVEGHDLHGRPDRGDGRCLSGSPAHYGEIPLGGDERVLPEIEVASAIVPIQEDAAGKADLRTRYSLGARQRAP